MPLLPKAEQRWGYSGNSGYGANSSYGGYGGYSQPARRGFSNTAPQSQYGKPRHQRHAAVDVGENWRNSWDGDERRCCDVCWWRGEMRNLGKRREIGDESKAFNSEKTCASVRAIDSNLSKHQGNAVYEALKAAPGRPHILWLNPVIYKLSIDTANCEFCTTKTLVLSSNSKNIFNHRRDEMMTMID